MPIYKMCDCGKGIGFLDLPECPVVRCGICSGILKKPTDKERWELIKKAEEELDEWDILKSSERKLL